MFLYVAETDLRFNPWNEEGDEGEEKDLEA